MSKIPTSEPLKKLEVEMKLLERIAEYYEFPLAVFFGNVKMFGDRTRNVALRKKAGIYDKIKELMEE